MERERLRVDLSASPAESLPFADVSFDVVTAWARPHYRLRAMFYYDVPVPFTRESWRGRMRALRGIGASLSADEVERFDRRHADLLAAIAREQFTIWHRIDPHFLEPRR